MAEGASRTVMLRKGWTGEEVKPGDTVKVVRQRARNGTNVVQWEWLVLPDGEQLWGEDIDPRKLQELRERRK